MGDPNKLTILSVSEKRNQTKKLKNEYEKIEQAVWDFFIEDTKKYGFEVREGQQDMALDIVDALKANEHILVEAGVGIGKSFAYIVPILYYHKVYQKPIVIATSTIALQEQLEGDIKRISKIIRYPIEVVLSKGQTHFVCRDRADGFLAPKRKEHPYSEINRLTQQGASERKDFPFQVDQKIWDEICIKRYNSRACRSCKHYTRCAFPNLRERMKETTGIILCNQDLLTVHLRKMNAEQSSFFSKEISVIVIDEAHNLEDKVRNTYTESCGRKRIKANGFEALRSLRNRGHNFEDEFQAVEDHLDELFSTLNEQVKLQMQSADSDMKYAERFSLEFDAKVELQSKKLYSSIKWFYDLVGMYFDEDRASDTARNASEELDEIVKFFKAFSSYSKNHLFWIQKSGELEICQCPKSIATITRELYFSRTTRTILTSATISNCNDGTEREKYDYFIRNTGFPVKKNYGMLSEPKPSPFPYDKHAMLYCSDDLPHPRYQRQQFIDEAIARLVELLHISAGKALVLFTAKSDLEVVYGRLSEMNLPYKILTQTSGSSQDKVLSEFRENVNSVLLGTGAYWEGINIEGKSLSNLIIFRLPFPVPDPIIEYKCSIAQDKLMDVLVPEMIIKLKQGIGRLIRNYTDKGIVSILDPRLSEVSKSTYKEMVFDALAIKIRTNSIEEIKRFYMSLYAVETSVIS